MVSIGGDVAGNIGDETKDEGFAFGVDFVAGVLVDDIALASGDGLILGGFGDGSSLSSIIASSVDGEILESGGAGDARNSVLIVFSDKVTTITAEVDAVSAGVRDVDVGDDVSLCFGAGAGVWSD